MTVPTCIGRLSAMPWASPMGRYCLQIETFAGSNFPHTVAPPSPSKISPTLRLRFAIATTSPQKSLEDPVGTSLRDADNIEIFNSKPIR